MENLMPDILPIQQNDHATCSGFICRSLELESNSTHWSVYITLANDTAIFQQEANANNWYGASLGGTLCNT